MFQHFPVKRTDYDGPVLVTGAGGCIGSWALALLARAGVPAVAFDLSDDKRRPRLLMSEEELAGVRWLTGDISDYDAVVKTRARRAGRRAIVHLAALQVPFCKADPVAGAMVNVVGTVNVLEAARKLGIQRVTYASSIAAHGAMEGHGTLAHAVRRLQVLQRGDRQGLFAGLGRAQRRLAARCGVRGRTRSGHDVEDDRGDPRGGCRQAL